MSTGSSEGGLEPINILPGLRCTDAQRDEVLERLETALASGELKPDEWERRRDYVLACETVLGLNLPVQDLYPAGAADRAQETSPRPVELRPAVSFPSAREKLAVAEAEAGIAPFPARAAVRLWLCSGWAIMVAGFTAAVVTHLPDRDPGMTVILIFFSVLVGTVWWAGLPGIRKWLRNQKSLRDFSRNGYHHPVYMPHDSREQR